MRFLAVVLVLLGILFSAPLWLPTVGVVYIVTSVVTSPNGGGSDYDYLFDGEKWKQHYAAQFAAKHPKGSF